VRLLVEAGADKDAKGNVRDIDEYFLPGKFANLKDWNTVRTAICCCICTGLCARVFVYFAMLLYKVSCKCVLLSLFLFLPCLCSRFELPRDICVRVFAARPWHENTGRMDGADLGRKIRLH
jgi:hypothetical protein